MILYTHYLQKTDSIPTLNFWTLKSELHDMFIYTLMLIILSGKKNGVHKHSRVFVVDNKKNTNLLHY